jgi:hypothetical protein
MSFCFIFLEPVFSLGWIYCTLRATLYSVLHKHLMNEWNQFSGRFIQSVLCSYLCQLCGFINFLRVFLRVRPKRGVEKTCWKALCCPPLQPVCWSSLVCWGQYLWAALSVTLCWHSEPIQVSKGIVAPLFHPIQPQKYITCEDTCVCMCVCVCVCI